MFVLVVVTLSTLIAAAATEDEVCTTPDGETGKCISITDCPTMFDALANPKKEKEAYLAKFLCKSETPDKERRMSVCCSAFDRFTGQDDQEDLEKIKKLSDRRYCGLQHRDDYFSNDTSITIDEFPWLAIYVVGTISSVDLGIRCAGTLINSRYVLTTARCVTFQKSLNDKPEVIRLGDFHLSNKTDCVELSQFNDSECNTYLEYVIEEKIPHPFFDYLTNLNDIALIRLNKPVVYSDYVRPICLPIPGTTFAQPGDIMYVTGLGNWKWTLNKKKIKAKLMTVEDCKKEWDHIYKYTSDPRRPLTSNQFCTWYDDDNKDQACDYDEGSPTMFSHNNQWHLEGTLVRPNCYRKEPRSNTKVSKYLRWIVRNIRP